MIRNLLRGLEYAACVIASGFAGLLLAKLAIYFWTGDMCALDVAGCLP